MKGKITEKDYMEIKGWLKHCDDIPFISAKTGISKQTIYRMRRTVDFTEYRSLVGKPAEKPAKTGQITVDEVMKGQRTEETGTAAKLGIIIGYLRELNGNIKKLLETYPGMQGGEQA